MTLPLVQEEFTKYKILLVDDDETALEELTDIVDFEGWEGITANSVENALSTLAADQEIRVILTDVHFVDPTGASANGIQFVSRAQAQFPERNLSYIVLSGDPDALKSAVQVGAFNFLSKPLKPEDLVGAIKGALASGGGERKNPREIHDFLASFRTKSKNREKDNPENRPGVL